MYAFFKQASVKATFVLIICFAGGQWWGIPHVTLTPAQQITAYILILAAILWVTEWVPLYVVSFLILALEITWLLPVLQLSDASVQQTLFYSAFFSDIILLFIGGFVLSSLMQKFGLDLMFAQAILAKTKGRPAATLLGIILACSFLSMWISNTATTAMMLTIVFPLLKHIDSDHPFRIALILAIPFACNIGGIGTPIGTPPNAIALTYLSQQGITLTFAQWMLLTGPFLILFLAFLWLFLLKRYPAGNLILTIQTRETTQLQLKHILALAIFAITAIGWFTSSSLGFTAGTVALFPVIAAFWLKLLDAKDFRSLPWDILYIISGGMALGIALTASGLDRVLVAVFPTESGPWLLIFIAAFVAGLMSTVMSNTATAGLVIPLVMSLGLPPLFMVGMVLVLAMMCSMAMALPVTTPPNAIAFSSRAIATKDMIISGGVITLVGFTTVVTLGPLYWRHALTWINF